VFYVHETRFGAANWTCFRLVRVFDYWPAGRYSIAEFYERRLRRIFPALFTLLAIVLPLFAWVLFPAEVMASAWVAVYTALFGSNFYFWRHSGYFNAAAELNPLTHTWSLAVEEQFYIAYPVLLAALMRRFPRAVAPALSGIAAASFVSQLSGSLGSPTTSFRPLVSIDR